MRVMIGPTPTDEGSYRQVVYAIEALVEAGPNLRSAAGRPDQGVDRAEQLYAIYLKERVTEEEGMS